MRPIIALLALAPFALGAYLAISIPAHALDDAVPGKSLWQVPLGITRGHVATVLQARFKGGSEFKRLPTHRFSGGLVEDAWMLPVGSNSPSNTLEILSKNGVVIQLQEVTTSERGQTDLTIGQLIRRHHLKKSAYGMDDPSGGGYEAYYFDDLKRGVCFTAGSQDVFLLTAKPQGIVIHRPGVSVIPVEGGIKGKLDQGPGSRVYANMQDYERAGRHEKNDY